MFNHNECFNYDLPSGWFTEDSDESLIFYNPIGNGAMTMSFFNVLNEKESLDEQISVLARNFITQNCITMDAPLILFNKDEKTILYGTGATSEKWFIKLWVVAKYPKIILATYLSERKNPEVKKCDLIIDSINFTF